jgi:hypothetical protein
MTFNSRPARSQYYRSLGHLTHSQLGLVPYAASLRELATYAVGRGQEKASPLQELKTRDYPAQCPQLLGGSNCHNPTARSAVFRLIAGLKSH